MAAFAALILAAAFTAHAGEGETTKKPAILRDVKKILFYGDSLTDGSSFPDYVVNTLRRVWPEAGFELMNAGICGNSAANLVSRLKEDVLARKPHLVIITIGTNDCLQKRPIKDYRADLDELVRTLRAAGIGVMLVRPSHLGDAGNEKRFEDYLGAINEVAAVYNLPVADAHGEFLRGKVEGLEMLGPDGVHHGRHGFEGMARAVLDALELKGAEIDKTVKPWPGVLTSWEMSDPALDGEYAPRKARGWKPYDAVGHAAKQNWYNVDFIMRGGWMPHSDAKQKQDTYYGRTYFHAPEAGDYELRLGGSTPQILWLNGKKVWEAPGLHGYHPDADFVPVRMKKGRNEIVALSNFLVYVGVGRLEKP